MNQPDTLTVQVDFSLAIGTGRLDASIDVPAGKVTLTQLLPALQTLSNNIIASTQQIVRSEGFEVSCRMGCAACCRQLVPLSLFEAESLTEYIRALPAARQTALEQRFRDTLLVLRDTGILARMDPTQWGGSEQLRTLAIDYMAHHVDCPFLENEICTIHSIRPMVCREYLVASPPELCREPAANPVVHIPIPLKLSAILYKLGAQIDRDNRGWMPLIFLVAWMQSNAHPGAAIAGPGPELLYECIRCLASA